MNNIYLLSFLSSFIFTIILFILFIPLFRYLKCGQSIRLEGPKEHYKKSGTPTMGGVLITLGFSIPFLIVTNLICHIPFNTCFLFILPSYLYMIIGFIDDYLIVIRKNNQGLKPRTKIIMQIIGVIIYYIFFVNQSFSHIVQIFSFKIDLKWGYGLFSNRILHNIFYMYFYNILYKTKSISIVIFYFHDCFINGIFNI